MKKIFTLLILTILTSLSASAYVPLVREGVEWGYYKDYWDWQHLPEYEGCYRLQFKGETVINGQTYLKLYQYDTPTLDTETTLPRFYMREEGKKVYVMAAEGYRDSRFFDWDPEGPIFMDDGDPICLIYDFNLGLEERNDDILDEPYQNWCGYAAKEISSVMIDGVERVIYKLGSGERSPMIIEGIGPVDDGHEIGNMPIPWCVFETGAHIDYHIVLYERKVDTGEIVYKSPYFDECAQYDPTVTPDGIEAPAVVRPLEVTVDGRTLTFPTLGAAERVNVTTLDGRTLYTGTPAHVDFPAPGIYLISTPAAHAKIAVK